MNAGTLALAALGLPFCSFVLLAVVPPLRRAGRVAGAPSIAPIGGSLLASLVLGRTLPRESVELTWPWLPAEGGPMATVGILVGHLAARMLVLVALVSFLGPPHPLPLALRVLDAGAGARLELPPDVHLLGAGRALLLSPDRLLVHEARGGAGRGKGVLGDEGRGPRLYHRHRFALGAGRNLPVLRALPDGRGQDAADGWARAHHVPHLSRGRRQERLVPPPRLAPRGHGGTHAGLGPAPRST